MKQQKYGWHTPSIPCPKCGEECHYEESNYEGQEEDEMYCDCGTTFKVELGSDLIIWLKYRGGENV